jgi:type VI secretion system secreted protein Hcp
MKRKYTFTKLHLVLALGITGIVFFGVMSNSFVNASTDEITKPPYEFISMYLDIEGMDGEVSIPGHEYEIEVLGYSHSIDNPFDLGTGQLTTKQHSPLRIMKLIDKTSPKLMEKCAKNAIIPTVTLSLYYEPDGLVFYIIELTNASVTSYQGFSTAYGNEVPRETVSFTYQKIKWRYADRATDGSIKGWVEAEDYWVQQPPP